MINPSISEETIGYVTSEDPANTDKRFLMAGSQNVLIDRLRRVMTRGGYTRLGVASAGLTTTRSAWAWETSTGVERAIRSNDGIAEVWLNQVDGITISAWTQFFAGFSTTKKLRHAEWFDVTERIDVQLMVCGDANIYEWSGAIAVVDSASGTVITKKGTTTFAQNRFYTTRNKVVVCVRTGAEYTYTAGEGTTSLTVTTDASDLVSGDILIQKVVTQSNKPLSDHTNDVIFGFENQIVIGSYGDNLVYISKNSDYTSVATSTPRVAGEGATLTLDSPIRGINSLGKLLTIFSGLSSIYKTEYAQITVGSTLAETIKVKRLDTGVNQGALNHESIVPVGDSLAFLTNEVAVRLISNPEDLTGIDPKTLSNPIDPDVDAEDWTGAEGTFAGNALLFTVPTSGKLFMLNFIEDTNGNLNRFWNPPQTFPIGPMSIFDADGNGRKLYGHSNTVAESYLLFDGRSDGQYVDMDVDDKLPIDCRAVYAYDRSGPNSSMKGYPADREKLKTFDEWFVEGEITPNSKPTLGLDYDFDGATQHIDEVIDGSDEGILEGNVVVNSLAQSSLGNQPLAGLLLPPADARRFHVVFDEAREDFFQIRDTYQSNEVDVYWAITARGSNKTLSPRRPINIHR